MKYTSEHISGVLDHKIQVGNEINKFTSELFKRAVKHDFSKFSDEEMNVFEQVTPKLKGLTYGSNEYMAQLGLIKPALDHHYANNSHHPEFYPNGLKDMNLMDVVEMLCDWLAAAKQHDDGNIFKSIKVNQNRFGYSDELKKLLTNTVRSMHKYCIEWGCCDGREGGYIGNTVEEIHKQIDKDISLGDAEKDDLKYGFFREFKGANYTTKNVCWDNAFDVYWTRN
ncbi:DUF5662 family protein [Brevibacillus sp. NRS-1366]|uniref:DUF5662 family protein n=1 Tax=Brevibacillus sp. NRS-1366 TaxID=3233899 RepID=UPI003D21A136